MNSKEDAGKATNTLRFIGETMSGRKISVLVVDDDFVDRRIMVQMFRSVGFDVVGEAKNGLLGLELFKSKKPQIVVLDYKMPKMNGKFVLVEIKKIDPDALVVMSTSMDDKDTVVSLLKAGADEYIVKPIDRQLVIEKMTHLVDAHDLSR